MAATRVVRIRHQRALNQARMRRKLWPTAERMTLVASPARPEVAASEVTFGLQVADDGLDGGAAAQLALDDTEDAALLAGDEDATEIWCVMAEGHPCRHRPARSNSR